MNLRLMTAATVLALGVMTTMTFSGATQTAELHPGRYDASMQITIMGEAEPPEKDEQCLTADDVKRLDRWLAATQGDTCTVSDRKVDAGTVTFSIICKEDGSVLTTRAELTTARDSFKAILKTTEDAGVPVQSVITITAKRIGDCAS